LKSILPNTEYRPKRNARFRQGASTQLLLSQFAPAAAAWLLAI